MYTDRNENQVQPNINSEAAVASTKKEIQWKLSREATQYYRSQDYRGALAVYEQLMEQYPNHVWYAVQRAQCLFKLHRYHEALHQLNQAEAMGCSDPLLHYWFGKAFFELKLYDDAIAALRAMLNINPLHLRSRFLLLRAYQQSRKHDLAKAEYEYLLNISDLAPEFKRHLGKIAYSLGDYHTALRLVESILVTPNFCHAGNYHLIAQILLKLEDNQRALYYLEAALLERRDGYLLKDYGVLLMQLKRYDDARNIFIELEKERKYEATGRYYLGLTDESAGNYNQAAASYRTVLKRNPRHLYGALKLAGILERQRRVPEALEVLRGIAVHQPGNTGLQSRIRNLEKDYETQKKENFDNEEK